MAKRKRHKRRGLGYGCPCVVSTRKSACVTVPIPGTRKVKTVCRTPFGDRVTHRTMVRKSRAKYSRARRLRVRRGRRLTG
jgi:hypothetical protein